MNAGHLERTLRRACRLARLTEAVSAGAGAVAVLATAALVLVTLDALLALPVWALVLGDAVLALAALAGVLHVVWTLWVNRYEPRRVARMLEARLDIRGSFLINGVDLLAGAGPGASVSLAGRAVAQAEGLAKGLDIARVVDRRRLRRRLAAAGAAMVVLVAAWAALPRVFAATGTRYLAPTSDRPPFTLLEFAVSWEPQRIHQGRPATIIAVVRGDGALPRQADVVFVDTPQRQRVPMVREEDGSFALRIDRVDRPREFHVATPLGRSERYHLEVLPVPVFRHVRVRYEYPEYTNWQVASETLEAEGIHALSGTRVTVSVQSNLPLREGRLTLHDEPAEGGAVPATQEVTLAPTDDPSIATGSFVLDAPGRFEIHLAAADGTESNEPLVGPVVCVVDRAPQVRFEAPGAEVVIPASWRLPLRIAADDDVAVSRIGLFRSVNGLAPSTVELPVQRAGPAYVTAETQFDLAALGAAGGDVITYYATAFDGRPGEPQFTDTRTFVVRVVTDEEYHEFVRSHYQVEQMVAEMDAFVQRLGGIGQRREELIADFEALRGAIAAAGGKATDAERQRLDEIDGRHEQYVRLSQSLADQLLERAVQPAVYELEEPYTQMLRELADLLTKQAQDNALLREDLAAMRQRDPEYREEDRYAELVLEQLRVDRDAMDPTDQEAQQVRNDLDRMRRAAHMQGLAEAVAGMAGDQRELADRLGQFRNRERLDPVEQIRARRYGEEQAGLHDELDGILRELERCAAEEAAGLPQMAASALEIVAAVRDIAVLEDQDDAARLAQAGQARYAHRSAETAARKLERLLEENQPQDAMAGAGGNDLDQALNLGRQRAANTLRQLGRGSGGGAMSGGRGGADASSAPVAVVGPHTVGKPDSPRIPRGQAPRGSSAPTARAERMTPEEYRQRVGSGAGMPGVPGRYREAAEAYFRRLADESR